MRTTVCSSVGGRPYGRRLLWVLLVFVPLWTSCGVSRTRVVPIEELPFPSLDATREQLLRALEETSRAVQTLTATVNFTASAGALTRGEETIYRETRGFLLVDRPLRIRMRGEAPLALVTVFDMVSDGQRFQVSVPVQNKLVIGDTTTTTTSENAILNLRPHHIVNALFVDVAAYLDRTDVLPIFYEAKDGRRSFYVFEFVDSSGSAPSLIEKIWIDRRDLRASRKQIFAADGAVQTDVTYSLYSEVGGTSFPHSILIERPVEDYSLEIDFNRVELNEAIEANAFMFIAPPGAEVVDITQTGAEPSN